MIAYDFRYDGHTLSEFGFMLCKFNNDSQKTVSCGSPIVFNTLSSFNGNKNYLISTNYEDCIETTFQICKILCDDNILEISLKEIRELTRWLCRKGFYEFQILDDEYVDVYFYSTFNLSYIENNGKVYGLELQMKTNKPYATKSNQLIEIASQEENQEVNIIYDSDDEGYTYPETKITLNEDCDLDIYNKTTDVHTRILNCKKDETISLNYPMITSSDETHIIQNDFNWNFVKLSKKYNKEINTFIISSPCCIEMVYQPIVKIGL